MNSVLNEEIIIEILKKASLKSLHRLKWVSKSWHSLINNEVLLPQVVKYPDPCIYYTYHNGNGVLPFTLALANPNEYRIILNSFDFLPNNTEISIFDSCNGLILCGSCKNCNFFVCNPVDKTYIKLPFVVPRYSPYYLLNFDPLNSPHYNLVFYVDWSTSSGALEFEVYDSSKQHFQKTLVHVQGLYFVEWRRHSIALWKGYVYFECGLEDSPGEWGMVKVLKISGVLQGGATTATGSYEIIKFPGGVSYSRKGELDNYMGTWKEKLRFVSISARGIKAWALTDEDEDEWRLEHDCTTTFLGLSQPLWMNSEEPQVVGFHPIRNALLIVCKRILYAFDFDRSSFEEFWEFENDYVFSDKVLCFSPCFANQVLA